MLTTGSVGRLESVLEALLEEFVNGVRPKLAGRYTLVTPRSRKEVVVTSNYPQVIVVDEPHSFLHPGALRKLFGTFSEYGQHQYIITTHSPAATLVSPSTSLNIVRRVGHESSVVPVRANNTGELREFLDEVGARFSDVFGPDRILWVEGKSEERAFALLLSAFAPSLLVGLEVLAVQQTGDLDGRHARRVFDIYRRLTTGVTILPPAVAFTLDQEGRSQEEREQLKAYSGGLMHFLPRRMYDNYLLVPSAIVAALVATDPEHAASYGPDAVATWLSEHGAEASLFRSAGESCEWTTAEWANRVDGARVLQRLFQALSDGRVEYDKVRHGSLMTADGIASGDASLKGLVTDWLAPIIAAKST